MSRLPVYQFQLSIEADAIEALDDLSTKIYKGVTSRTPVRTGQTRQSWNMTAGDRNIQTVDEGGAPGSPLPPPVVPKLNLTKFEKIFITNAKRHVIFLEKGSPTTEPTGMVAATLSSL